MRLTASIEKNGYFWLSGEEEDALSGILKISKKGQVSLELMVPVEFPKATVQIPWAFSSDDDNISFDKIIGKVEGDEFVTLCQCECLTPFSGSNTLQAAVAQFLCKLQDSFRNMQLLVKITSGKKKRKFISLVAEYLLRDLKNY